MSAYTALCPSCNAEMDLGHKEMEKAGGDIICGNCNHQFHAPDHLLKGFYPSGTNAASSSAANTDRESKIDLVDNILTTNSKNSYASYKRKKRMKTFFGLLINGALVAAFLFQLAWVRFDDWSAKEHLRPVYSFMCAVRNLNCNLPAFVEPSALVLEDVRVDLRDDAVYVVRGNIRNRSKYSQSFPWVEVVFSDADSNRLATGRFSPDQYLADRVSNGDTSIRTNGNTGVLLEIRKPSGNPVNYRTRLIAVAP